MQFIGVGGRDEIADMQNFVSQNGVSGFEHLADEANEVWATYGVTSQPAFVFINDDGTSETLIAALGEARLEEMVLELIG